MATFHCLSPGHLAVVAAAAFFLLASPALTLAQEKPPPWLLCGPYPSSGNYTANSTYQSNIHSLSLSLPTNTSSTPALFATGVAGAVPDAVYALALCRGDVANASACESCVAMAFVDAQARCPLVKDVLIFYDLCQLRFSNRDFFPDDDNVVTVYDLIGGSLAVGEPAAPFDAAVRRLANATADYAAKKNSSSSRSDKRSNPTSWTIYALSQCTPDKDRVSFCRSCFGQIVGQLSSYFSGKSGGGIFGTWCFFRYEVHPFFSGRPMLQLPASMAVAPAPAPAQPATTNQGLYFADRSRNKEGKVLAIVMPTIAVLMMAITVLCFCKRRRSAAQYFRPCTASPDDDIQGADMLPFDLSTLRVATNHFAESKMLGKGGFGMVYKGVLPDGQEIAVKRLCQSSRQGIGELKSELVLVAKLHHKNLVRLVGVCLQEQEKILVYEYTPNRSLDTILFDSVRNEELDWGKRLKIINGVARGLQYLHEDSQLKIVHRDLKASNVLLDSDYVPKISDFGLAKIFWGDQSKYVTRRVAGTYGYMAPEYAMRGLYSIKSDVFSFGVLLLEIVTGRRNNGLYDSEHDVDLLNLVWEHWTTGTITELLDPFLLGRRAPLDQMSKLVNIGLLCVQDSPADRPTVSSVNVMLSSDTVSLQVPSKPTFCISEMEDHSHLYSDAYNRAVKLQSTDKAKEALSTNEVSLTELEPR
ncbi:hypothetical protein HU200_053160 [Digitaria exilis]|uniref:Cysteine-rich receptor-like protein kinase 10 n=1 Tax=Digitaria exilis TaxID=1010633 RepID=A0A835E8L4_9POAL|nr:hypothetical protein HU200_053160 [Digitaria exilis]